MQLRILIVNENEPFCSFLSGFLEAEGNVTKCCAGDREGFKQGTDWRPDLIIVEASSPESGFMDVIQHLRRHEATRRLPVIVISDNPGLEYELPHVFDFLHRPIDMNRLREDVKLLRKGRKRPPPPRHEPLSDSEYQQFSEFLVSHSGLHFERRNMRALERGLRARMETLQIGSYADYFEYLEVNQEARMELQKLLQHLTVGETFFFRYNGHFQALRKMLLEDYLPHPKKTLRLWSAGCSTGEEPYSLAMTIMEALPDWRKRDIRIVATDINNRSLKRAEDGVYGKWAMRVMEEKYLSRYFRRVGESYLLRREVKELVTFSHLNLQADQYPHEKDEHERFDTIFCRNVMIYFTQATNREIVERLAAGLKPGGALFLGHSETLAYLSNRFERQTYDGSFYYRKKSESAVSRRSPPPVQTVPVERPRPRRMPLPPPPVRMEPILSGTAKKEADVEELYVEAQKKFEAEEFRAAAEIIEKILYLNPQHERALVLHGFVSANQGQFSQALSDCDHALTVNDLLPEAYFLRGMVLDMVEKQAEAVEEYRKAILLKMDFVMPHYHLGRLFIRLGRRKEGIRELMNSLKILERGGIEKVVPYSGGLSREVFIGQLRSELDRVA